MKSLFLLLVATFALLHVWAAPIIETADTAETNEVTTTVAEDQDSNKWYTQISPLLS